MMLKVFSSVVAIFFTFTVQHLTADASPPVDQDVQQLKDAVFEPFTGKITRNRVRLRLYASLDSPIVRELDRDEMLLVTGETDEFYAVHPPANTKAFIYRTYVLEGVVEGSCVNIRLAPHLDAPVVGQLNRGNPVEGIISSINSKWLEITPPASIRFYVADDYIEKIGDADFLQKFNQQHQEVTSLLNRTCLAAKSELKKPFTEIDLEMIQQDILKIEREYSDFSEVVLKAQDLLSRVEEEYLHKKVAYLEAKNKTSAQVWKGHYGKAIKKIEPQQMSESERSEFNLQQEEMDKDRPGLFYEKWMADAVADQVTAKMASWIPVELSIYEKWAKDKKQPSIQNFYEQQKNQTIALRGIIEAYNRPLHNKPGDYLLLNKVNKLPIAYLYSTHVNLQDKVGHEATIFGVNRPNNHFAYPAYFVLNVE